MPHYDAASLATPAAVSHEGRLSVVATGSRRRGDSVCQVAAFNPSRTAFRHYLLAKIAPGAVVFQKAVLASAPTLQPSRLGSALSGGGGGVQGGGGTWKPLCFIGCIWFQRPPCSRVGKGQSDFSLRSPEAFKFLLPFRKGVPFFTGAQCYSMERQEQF